MLSRLTRLAGRSCQMMSSYYGTIDHNQVLSISLVIRPPGSWYWPNFFSFAINSIYRSEDPGLTSPRCVVDIMDCGSEQYYLNWATMCLKVSQSSVREKDGNTISVCPVLNLTFSQPGLWLTGCHRQVGAWLAGWLCVRSGPYYLPSHSVTQGTRLYRYYR